MDGLLLSDWLTVRGQTNTDLKPNPNIPGAFLKCPVDCRSRIPSIPNPPDWTKPKVWNTFGNRFYGCRPDIAAGSCYFLPPARRLIANPDGVQLVFYENEHDCGSAAVAFRYAIHGYNLPLGEALPFPDFSVFPGSDYLTGSDISNVEYTGSTGFQGRWRQAYHVANQPLAICNYNRFNDLPPPTSVAQEGGVGLVQRDAHGHPWRPFTFPRPFAVYSPNPSTVLNWRCPPK
jgi:hypothetical protein